MERSTSQTPAPSVLHHPILLGSLGFGFLSFALPLYGRSQGASALEIGGLFSLFSAIVALLRPLVGWALDRFGRKVFLIAALCCYAAAMSLFATVPGMAGLYLGQLVRGLASAMMWISAYTIATDLASHEQRGNAVGRVDEAVGQGSLFGGVAGFVIMTKLPQDVGWPVVFACYAIMAAVGAWIGWRNVPETKPLDCTPAPAEHLLSGHLVRLIVIVFITAASMAMVGPVFLIFLSDRLQADIATLMLAIVPAAVVMGFLPARLGRLSDRFGRTRFMALGLAGSGLVSLCIPWLPGLAWLAVLWTVESVGWAIAGPAQEAMIADLTDHQMRGRGYGLYTFAAGLGATVGPLLGGWLYDAAGHVVPFYLNGVILLAGVVLVLLLLSPRPTFLAPPAR